MRSWLASNWIGLCSLLLAIPSIVIATDSCNRSARLERLQFTPRVSAQAVGKVVAVEIRSGTDWVVEVPLVISNNSDALALKVEFDLTIADGTGYEAGINDYRRKHGRLPFELPRLDPRATVPVTFRPDVRANAAEAFRTGQGECRIKVTARWTDIDGHKYWYVSFARLGYSPPLAEDPGGFRFETIKAFDSVLAAGEAERYSRASIKDGMPAF